MEKAHAGDMAYVRSQVQVIASSGVELCLLLQTLIFSRAFRTLRDATQVVTFLSVRDKKCREGPKR